VLCAHSFCFAVACCVVLSCGWAVCGRSAFGAVMERGSCEDALVVHSTHRSQQRLTLDSLPAGSVIGTSALRRVAVIAKHYPHLVCKVWPVRSLRRCVIGSDLWCGAARRTCAVTSTLDWPNSTRTLLHPFSPLLSFPPVLYRGL
jgi:hydroxymethylbilane synthase